jgi:peptidoglycan/LPS O-acetylase OafA/YrhL
VIGWVYPGWPDLAMLGDASYAIYILYVPKWLWWNRMTRVLLHLDIPPAIDFFASMPIVLLAPVLIARCFEKPIRQTGRMARRWPS